MNQSRDLPPGIRSLTVDDVVQSLRLSRDTIDRLATSGERPRLTLGHKRRCACEHVVAYVRPGRRRPLEAAMPAMTTRDEYGAAVLTDGRRSSG